MIDAVVAFEKAGARVVEVSVPLIAHAAAIYVGIAEPEATALFRPYLLARAQDIDVLPRQPLLRIRANAVSGMAG